MGCCLLASVMAGAPRLAFLVWWLFQPGRIMAAFNDTFIWPLLGLLFAPWTTLAYVMVAPGGIVWFDWLFIGIAVLIDLGSYGGGGYSGRQRYAAA